ncbi:heterodisulfide reductase-related iron-sulfur binding cluster [Paenibacillus naphthalenovorans]|uniref:(Fe-S)-binding protein n=1 Tax=Paenibacillus naphthalenovorans TaxID=162209 RepID=UPI003D28C2B2
MRGWHPSATLGVIAAAAAAGKLYGFDQMQFKKVFGLASSMMSGLKINFGTMTKPYHIIGQHAEHRGWVKWMRTWMFRYLFPRQNKMRMLGLALQIYQKSGFRRLAQKLRVTPLFGKNLSQMERIIPDASYKGVIEQLGTTVIPAKGGKVARVGMFRGCVMDVLFTKTNLNTVRLLSEAGFEVVIPPGQNCCGALHAHSGEMDQARTLAVNNIAAFREANVDYIVSNAGGCGALLSEYDHLLHDDPQWAEVSEWFASRVKDVSLILLEKGRVPEFAAWPGEKITYQDSCHLRNVMRSSAAPRQLMKRIKNVQFVELPQSDQCCGSAGIYNLVQPDMAAQILDHKMENVRKTDAQYLLTSNPGCLLQMKLGIERADLTDKMQAVHIVDFLYERMPK